MRKLTAVFLTAFFLAINTGFVTNLYARPLKNNINYAVIALVPEEKPDYWSLNGNLSLKNLDSQMSEAVAAWSSISDEQISIRYQINVTQPIKGLSRCDYQEDWKAGLKAIESKLDAVVTHYIFVNPSDTCKNPAYGLVGGNKISLRDISSTLIAHEIGHNLGFRHSAYVTCPKNSFKVLRIDCQVEQYGDKSDVMGSGFALKNSQISLAQKYLVWGSPKPKLIKTGNHMVKRSPKNQAESILRLNTRDGYALLEFSDSKSNGGYKASPYDGPGVQIRLINTSFAKRFSNNKESGIGTLLLAMQRGLDENGNCPELCYVDSRIQVGMKINIPNSNYVLQIIKTSETSASIQIKGKL